MKKGLCFILGIVIILGVLIGINAYVNYEVSVSDEIPEGYLFVLHGGSGEVTKSTYIYKIDNGHANMGFKYINTENHTESWGSSEWITKIVDEGEFDFTDGAFVVAKKHGAYSYVVEPGNDKTYTIEEYQNRFIMN
jgi:hypothetical protein